MPHLLNICQPTFIHLTHFVHFNAVERNFKEADGFCEVLKAAAVGGDVLKLNINLHGAVG